MATAAIGVLETSHSTGGDEVAVEDALLRTERGSNEETVGIKRETSHVDASLAKLRAEIARRKARIAQLQKTRTQLLAHTRGPASKRRHQQGGGNAFEATFLEALDRALKEPLAKANSTGEWRYPLLRQAGGVIDGLTLESQIEAWRTNDATSLVTSWIDGPMSVDNGVGWSDGETDIGGRKYLLDEFDTKISATPGTSTSGRTKGDVSFLSRESHKRLVRRLGNTLYRQPSLLESSDLAFMTGGTGMIDGNEGNHEATK
ncbi:hypothetical protein EV182_003713, partial [Spiromyces aspiralis]